MYIKINAKSFKLRFRTNYSQKLIQSKYDVFQLQKKISMLRLIKLKCVSANNYQDNYVNPSILHVVLASSFPQTLS